MNLFDLDASISLNSEDFVQGIQRAMESGGKIVESMYKASESVRQYQDKLKNIGEEYSAQTAKANELAEKQQSLIEKVNQSRESVEKANEKVSASEEKYKSLSESLTKSQERYDKLSEALNKAVEEFGEESEEAQKARENLEQAGDTVYKYQERVDKAADAVEKYKKQLGKAQSQLSQNQGELKSTNAAIDRNIEALNRNRDAAQRAIEESKKIGLIPKALAGAAEGIQKISSGFNSAKNKVSEFINKIPGVSKAIEFKNTGLSRLKSDFDALKVVSQAFKEKLSPITNVIKNIASAAAKISFKAAQAGVEAFGNATKKAVEITGEIISTVGKVGTAAVGAASAAVVAFGKSAVDVGKDFDSSMSQIAATLGMSVDDIEKNTNGAGETFEALRNKAKEMGAATNFSASEAADGLNIIAMSGYSAGESIEMIEDVLHLAAAGGLDMATAAKDITGSMKGFNDATKGSEYYASLMAKGATLAATDVSELGEAMADGAAVAATYGQSAESMTVSLLRLAEQGETGSAASTALAAAMKNLYAPTDQAAAILNELGVKAFDETTGKARDFNEVVNELSGAMAGYNDDQKVAYAQTIFGIQGFNAYNKMVVTSADKQNEWTNALKNSAGEAAKQYDTMTDNLQGDIDTWNSALDGFKIEISDKLMPTVRDFVKFGSDGLSAITKAFQDGGLENAMNIFGDLLTEGIGKITSIIPTVIKVAATLVKSLGQAIVKNIPKIANSAVELLKGFAENIAQNAPTAIKGFSDMLKKVKDWIKENGKTLISSGMEMIKSIAQGISDNLSAMTGSVTEIITFIGQMLSDNLSLLLDSALNIVSAIGQGIVTNLPLLINSALEIIKSLANYLGENLPEMIPAVVDIILKIVETLTDPETLSGLVDAALSIIIGLADGLVNSLPELIERLPKIVQSIVDGIVDNVPKLLDAAIEILATLGEYLIDPKNLVDILDSGIEIIFSLVEGAGKVFWKLGNMAKEITEEIFNNLGLGEAYTWGEDLVKNFCKGIKDWYKKEGGLYDTMEEFGYIIYDWLHHSTPEKGPLKDDDKWGGDLMDNLINGVKSKEKSLADTIKGVAENIRDTFSKPISVNAGVHAKGTLSGFELPDISADTSIPFVADGSNMKKYNVINNPSVPSYKESESPIVVENLNINMEGMTFSSEYEMNRFINFIAEKLKAKNITDMRGVGGVMF